MSILEILNVVAMPVSSRTVTGFGLDAPILGSRHRAEAVEFKGWLIAGRDRIDAVEVRGDGGFARRIPLGFWRGDIAGLYPYAMDAERCGFRAALDLRGLGHLARLTLDAVFADGTRVPLASLVARRQVLPAQPDLRRPEVGSRPVLPSAGAPRASVVIPVHNQSGLTRDCLDALLAPGATAAPFETIVVDDGSSDDTGHVLAAFRDRVRSVRLSPNAGFGAACNTGAAMATAPHIVFLNNDTVPLAGWLDALLADADTHPDAAVIGSRLLFPDGSIQHAGVSIGADGFPHHLYAGFPGDHPAVTASRPMQAVTAACMLVRTDAFRAVGGFDRAFVNGWEDSDLCLRLGEAGYAIRYCAESVVLHLESASRDPHAARERRNRDRWAERWLGRARPDFLDFWIADGLLAVEPIGPLYPQRIRFAPEVVTCEPLPAPLQVQDVAAARGLPRLERQRTATGGRSNLRQPRVRSPNPSPQRGSAPA